MILKILDPTYEPAISAHGMAERSASLAGKRIGLLSNDKLNATELLDAIHEVLSDTFELGSPVRLNRGNASAPAPTEMLEGIAKEIDVALLGNGD
jgi:hypothetical protein